MNLPFDTYASALAAALSVGDGRIEFYTAIGAVLGVFLFYRGFRMLQYKRLVQNTPSSKIHSASIGLVEVSGMATGPQTIPAGMTGTPCYYYRATAWELQQSGRSSQWKKVVDESLYVPFFVEDITGRLLVNPQGADLDVHCTFRDELSTTFFSGRDLIPDTVMQFLNRQGLGVSTGNIRLEERCIEPGYPLFIFGTLGENPDRGNWTAMPHKAVASSSFHSRSTIGIPLEGSALGSVRDFFTAGSDTSDEMPPMTAASSALRNRSASGTASGAPAPNTWSSVSMDEVHPPMMKSGASVATSSAVADNANLQTSGPSGFDVNSPVALWKGTGHDPFAISSQSQREIVEDLRWKSTSCIWGGPILTLVCLYILLGMLGWR